MIQKSFAFLQELLIDYVVFSLWLHKINKNVEKTTILQSNQATTSSSVTEGYTHSNDTKLAILDFRQWNFSDFPLLLLLTNYLKLDAVEWCEFSLLTKNWTKC